MMAVGNGQLSIANEGAVLQLLSAPVVDSRILGVSCTYEQLTRHGGAAVNGRFAPQLIPTDKGGQFPPLSHANIGGELSLTCEQMKTTVHKSTKDRF